MGRGGSMTAPLRLVCWSALWGAITLTLLWLYTLAEWDALLLLAIIQTAPAIWAGRAWDELQARRSMTR